MFGKRDKPLSQEYKRNVIAISKLANNIVRIQDEIARATSKCEILDRQRQDVEKDVFMSDIYKDAKSSCVKKLQKLPQKATLDKLKDELKDLEARQVKLQALVNNQLKKVQRQQAGIAETVAKLETEMAETEQEARNSVMAKQKEIKKQRARAEELNGEYEALLAIAQLTYQFPLPQLKQVVTRMYHTC